ncbi:Endonuclease III [Buchnera aphidicola (Eriosoma lanigerum)]|uniref:endonuclease III n=1 Tax=Buchnera aphidicola TaxID=9 RepID=UPI003464D4E8
MNSDKRNEILNCFYKYMPNVKTELKFSSSFELLIAVILSARSTDKSVNKITSRLFQIANTPNDILKLGIKKLKFYIKHVGLYNIKAKHIIDMCSILINNYDGEIPVDRKNLEFLPGVGRKTANVILNTLFGKDVIAVDTHVFRVCNRTKFATGNTVIAVEKKLDRYVLDPYKLYFHNWFVLHGRYICTAKKIKCNICFIRYLCEFNKKIFYE